MNILVIFQNKAMFSLFHKLRIQSPIKQKKKEAHSKHKVQKYIFQKKNKSVDRNVFNISVLEEALRRCYTLQFVLQLAIQFLKM